MLRIKNHLALIPLLFLCKCGPLRWGRICLPGDTAALPAAVFTLSRENKLRLCRIDYDVFDV